MTALSRSRALRPSNPHALYYRLRVYVLRKRGTRRAMTGGMNLTDYLACVAADETPVPNANEPSEGERLYRFWFGAYGETALDVFADSPDDGFEVAVEWLDDNAPGHLIALDAEAYAEAARELTEETKVIHDPESEDEDVQHAIRERAEADLTPIGHTTLKHGQFVASWEWTFQELMPGAPRGQRPVAATVPSPSEREARIWAVLETALDDNGAPELHIYTVYDLPDGRAAQWCARLGNGPEHFGESRLDALAQLAQVVALR